MLTIGGFDPTAANDSTPDPFIYGLGIFDMTEWTWTAGYVADAKPYEPASQISQFYSTKYVISLSPLSNLPFLESSSLC